MSTPPVSGGTTRITVEAGDTLSEIAAENNISLEELLEANPQFDASLVDGRLNTNRTGQSGYDPDFIRAGDTIVLPKQAQPNAATGGGGPNGSTGVDGPAPGNPTSASGKADEAMRYFQSQGWSREQAAGIVANLQAESNFNEKIVGDGGAAYGIAQWHPDRQANFERVFGKDIRNSTFAEQLQFVQWELTHTESNAGNALKGASSAGEAASIVSRLYERPADTVGQANHRADLAQRYA
jgi:hypothetical protein